MDRDILQCSVKACYSTWSSRYYEDYYMGAGAYPPVHVDIVRGLLKNENVSSVLDAGCGPASMLRDLELPAGALFGFDLTPEMVAEARRVLEGRGLKPGQVWEGSVLDPAAFRAPEGGPTDGFDAALCFGVLPHIPSEADEPVLANLMNAVRPDGLVLVEARNELFGLFTLNRYSREFFRDRLIDEGRLVERTDPQELEALKEALVELDQRFRMDLPPMRKGYENEPGYDEILSRTHNPFELEAVARATGLVDIQILFYHFHAMPPMLEKLVPGLFRRESLAREDPADWRGHFMASAFILTGRRPAQP